LEKSAEARGIGSCAVPVGLGGGVPVAAGEGLGIAKGGAGEREPGGRNARTHGLPRVGEAAARNDEGGSQDIRLPVRVVAVLLADLALLVGDRDDGAEAV